jgi:hypothetical protein
MPKGIKNPLTLGEEIRELDRILHASVRKNLIVMRKLLEETRDEDAKRVLSEILSKHSPTPQESDAEPAEGPAPLSEREKASRRFLRLLNTLPVSDVQNLLELAKSMKRNHPGEK